MPFIYRNLINLIFALFFLNCTVSQLSYADMVKNGKFFVPHAPLTV